MLKNDKNDKKLLKKERESTIIYTMISNMLMGTLEKEKTEGVYHAVIDIYIKGLFSRHICLSVKG